MPKTDACSATTTASATDVLFKTLMTQRRVPALRTVPPYYDHSAYLDAVTAVIREELAKLAVERDCARVREIAGRDGDEASAAYEVEGGHAGAAIASAIYFAAVASADSHARSWSRMATAR